MNTASAQPDTVNRFNRPAAPVTGELLFGPSRRGPRCCLRCGRPFEPGQSWQRFTSPADERGTYRVGIHDQCP